MQPGRLILILVLLGTCWRAAFAEEGYDEQTSRHASAMEWAELTQRAEQAIRAWLLENKGEEQIWERHYYQFWGEQSTQTQRYLLVVTGLKQARGNYTVADLVVIRGDAKARPIILEFGDFTSRYIDEVELKPDGIQIDYYWREPGAYWPSIPRRSFFSFAGDDLKEAPVGLPDERAAAMEKKLADRERAVAQDEAARQQREKNEAARRIVGPDGKYTVHAGDTASKIARAFGLRVDQLSVLNPKVDWAKMKVGQVLQVRPDITTVP